MGQAEQRQVRSGVADRVRREKERSDHANGLLAQVRRHRTDADDNQRHLAGSLAGLRAAVGLAVLDNDPPSDDALAAAAGWALQDVASLRDELRARGPADARFGVTQRVRLPHSWCHTQEPML